MFGYTLNRTRENRVRPAQSRFQYDQGRRSNHHCPFPCSERIDLSWRRLAPFFICTPKQSRVACWDRPNSIAGASRPHATTATMIMYNENGKKAIGLDKLANIWRIKRDGISEIKFETAEFDFLRDVFVAVGLDVAETPYFSQAVCALRSLSIMGGIQTLIICVKMACSGHLDRGVNICYLRCRNIRFSFDSLPETLNFATLKLI